MLNGVCSVLTPFARAPNPYRSTGDILVNRASSQIITFGMRINEKTHAEELGGAKERSYIHGIIIKINKGYVKEN